MVARESVQERPDERQRAHAGLIALGDLEANLESFAHINDKVGGEWIARELKEIREVLKSMRDTEQQPNHAPAARGRDRVLDALTAPIEDAEQQEQGDGMVGIFIDGESYRVRPDVPGQFLISLRHRPEADWVVWREVRPEDIDAGWDEPLGLVGGERFYTTPKRITANAPSAEQQEQEARPPDELPTGNPERVAFSRATSEAAEKFDERDQEMSWVWLCAKLFFAHPRSSGEQEVAEAPSILTGEQAAIVIHNGANALRALAELVRLKDLKDAQDDLAWTKAEKEAAWARARELLAD